MKHLWKICGIVIGVAMPVIAAPTSGPAGNFLTNISTNVTVQVGNVSSITVSSQLSLPYINAGQCTSVNSAGQVIGTPCGASGAASIALTTGTSSGWVGPVISSPTAVILPNAFQFNLSLQGGSTAFLSLNLSSVTVQGNNLSATYLTNSSATANYLMQSSATATYLQDSSATVTYIQISTIVAVSHGGTGTTTPGLIAGTNITSITGTWPNQVINASLTSNEGIVSPGTFTWVNTAYGITADPIKISSSVEDTNAYLLSIATGSGTGALNSLYISTNGWITSGASMTMTGPESILTSIVSPDYQFSPLNGSYTDLETLQTGNLIVSSCTPFAGQSCGIRSAGSLGQTGSGIQTLTFSDNSQQTTAYTGTSGGQFINNQATLQSGATFYVSSGTVLTLNVSTFTLRNGIYASNSGDRVFSFNDSAGNNTNVFMGDRSGNAATTASSDVGIGQSALNSITTSANNTAVGNQALNSISTGGGGNTGVGSAAGSNELGNNNTYIGETSGPSSPLTLQNSIAIGFTSIVNSSNTTVIGNTSTSSGTIYGSINFPSGVISSSLSVVNSTNKYSETFSSTTASGPYLVDISSTGHLNFPGASSPTITACGTSPSVTGTDTAGRITEGTGGTSSCVLNFSSPFTNTPFCIAQTTSTVTTAAVSAVSNTSITIITSASLVSDTLNYWCTGKD